MGKKEKKIRELIEEVNRETAEKWESEIRGTKELDETFFTKWLLVQNNMEKRRDAVISIQKLLREQGHDVKINMVNYELYYLGKFPKEKDDFELKEKDI